METINWSALEDNITISLLLTMQCNFRCGHCMYECGPDRDATYMSNGVLSSVSTMIEYLHYKNIYPSLNLVGGEPTLNMERFGQVIQRFSCMDTYLEMTTNGWWLQDTETTREFFRAVRPAIPEGGGFEEGLSVRVSNDEFHDRFRPAWMQGDRLKGTLTDIWESGDVLSTPVYSCDDCGVEPDEGGMCPECGEWCDIDYYEDALEFAVPQPLPGTPWIYVDRSRGLDMVIPVGRGFYAGGLNERTCTGEYPPSALSFTPDGTLCDICCKGSWCEFGTVEDDPLVLLAIAWQFQKEMQPSCSGCREMARQWKDSRLEDVRREVIAQRDHD